jgi:hypothetical protein
MLTGPRLFQDPVRRLHGQGTRYVKSLGWLISDSIRVAPRVWLRIVAGTVLNLASNAAVAGAIYLYVDLLQQDARFEILGASIIARESIPLLVAFIAVMTVAMLNFAASEYVSKAAALRLHRRYQEHSMQRSLRLLQRLPDARCPQIAALVAAAGARRLVASYPHSCSWSLRFIGTAFPNLVLFFAGYMALLWLDLKTTALVSALGIALIAAQYPIHLLAARSSNVLEQTNPYVGQKLGELIDLATSPGGGNASDALNARLEQHFRDDRVKRNADADEDRFRAMDLSALSMQSGGGLILAAMLLSIGSGLLANAADWAVLIVYLTLLRRLLNAATTVFRTVTVFSRFSPHIQIYRSFAQGAAITLQPRTEPLAIPEALVLAARQVGTGPLPLRLTRGARVAFFTANGVSRELAMIVQAAIYEGQADKDIPVPEIRLLSLNEARSPEAVRDALGKIEASSAGVLLIDQFALAKLTSEQRSAWQQRLSDRYLLTIYTSTQSPQFDETMAVVRDRGDTLHWTPLAAGPLSEDAWRTIDDVLKSGSSSVSKTFSLEEDMG